MRGGIWITLLLAGLGLPCCQAGGGLEILSIWPADGAVGAPLDARIEVAFDRPIQLAGAEGGLDLTLDGNPVQADISVGEGGGPLLLTPQRFLLADRVYRVQLAATTVTDLRGRHLDGDLGWTFRTVEGCQIVASDQATEPTGQRPDGSAIIPGGRRITPPGSRIAVGSFPMNLLAWPDRNLVAVSNNGKGLAPNREQSVQLIDLDRSEVLTTIARPRPGAFFYGLALAGNNRRLYAAGGGSNLVETFDLTPEGNSLEKVGEYEVDGYPAGLLLDEERGLLFVAAQLDGEIVALDTATGEERWRRRVGLLPYDLVMDPSGQKFYVSLWGRTQLGDPGQVAVVNPADGTVLTKIDVGKNPEGLVLSADGRLFVACSDSDRVDVIDTSTDSVVASWPLRRSPTEPVGLSPVALAVDEQRSRLYVACAQKNSLDVLDLRTGQHLGSLPTGWYPTGVALNAAGDRLLILNAKGEGSGPKPETSGIHDHMPGSLSVTLVPSEEDLSKGAEAVQANNTWPLGFYPDRCLGKAFPLPRAIGEPSPIKHVIFVLRENKTYDQNLGDLEGANGDPSLVMFGEDTTPNLHALAREFCNLDNFFAEIEVSVQGHYWSVAGTINDYSEKVWHANYRDDSRLPSTGNLQPDYPAGKFIWHKLVEAGIDFRNYGEPQGIIGEISEFEQYVNKDYMLDYGLNLYSTPDEQRVRWFWDEVEAGIFPSFIFLGLFNDHTYGRRAGAPTPQWMVAENDYATGLLVDLVSHSEHWPETLIIVTEDDPQSGADHVDGHRSIALLISPYTRKGYTSSVNYGFSSLIRTYGLILGMPALNLLDETATPVYDCFTSTPDFSPYEARDNPVAYEENSLDMPGAWESQQMDFSQLDRADGLGSILWLATRPNDPIPPQLIHEEPWDEDLEGAEERWVLPVPLGPTPWREDRP